MSQPKWCCHCGVLSRLVLDNQCCTPHLSAHQICCSRIGGGGGNSQVLAGRVSASTDEVFFSTTRRDDVRACVVASLVCTAITRAHSFVACRTKDMIHTGTNWGWVGLCGVGVVLSQNSFSVLIRESIADPCDCPIIVSKFTRGFSMT